MTNTIERLRVILTAAVTWLVTIATVLTIAAAELGDAFGDDAAPIIAWIARILVVVGVAIAIIRRVTPVLPAARGVLTPDVYAPVTERERQWAQTVHVPSSTYPNPPP